MKIRYLKSAIVLLLICTLSLSLTGCDSLDYREAVNLYNAGSYAEAAEIFAQIPDYEDSAQLETRCYYWLAIKAMEYGRFEAAIEQFQALNGYEDSAQRIIECKYQLAVAAFEEGNLPAAESIFLEMPDYKQTPEYLRRITWQKLFDAVAAAGTEGSIQTERDGKVFRVTAEQAEPNQLIFFVSHTKDMGYSFYDDLSIILTRDSTVADLTANSTFTMDFKGSQIGSQQKGSGKLVITGLTAETVLTVDTYEKTATDNQGKTSTSTDPADNLMADDMAENLVDLMTVIPQLLKDSGIELTLQDIGFSALA